MSVLVEKYIKSAVKKALREQAELQKKSEKAVYLIYKFPGLKDIMEDLMSPAFARYISSISIVSPKPTTLNISLINGQSFYLYYSGQGNFVAKIAGRKYNTSEISDVERASKAITALLILNYASPEEEEEDKSKKKDNDIKKDLAMSDSGPGNFPGSEPSGGSDISDADLDNTPPDESGNGAPIEPNNTPEEGEQEDIEI